MSRVGDPFLSSLVALGALGVSGLVAVALAWRGAAAELSVASQVPFVMSGGFGGLALVGFAAGVLVIQHRRWVEARRRTELEAVIDAAAELLAAARQGTEDSQR